VSSGHMTDDIMRPYCWKVWLLFSKKCIPYRIRYTSWWVVATGKLFNVYYRITIYNLIFNGVI